MKQIKNILNKLSLLSFILVLSCDTLETELVDDPSTLNQSNAKMEFIFNQVQLSHNALFNNVNFVGSSVTRLEFMNAPSYEIAFSPEDFNGTWNIAYRNVLMNNKLVNQKIDEASDRNLTNYKAASKILEANTWLILTDHFNEIPFSQALQGGANLDPKRDSGSSIYEACYQMLQQAVTLIDNNAGSEAIQSDLYYGGNMAKWKRAAHSLMLQLVINSRIPNQALSTQRFNQLLQANSFINANADDFQFQYNNTLTISENRHPIFVSQYLQTASIYVSRDFLQYMAGDPRERYYFYRQRAGEDNRARIHGNALPAVGADYPLMPVHGLYPYGGQFDNNQLVSTTPDVGARGAGINVFLSNFATQFLIAEGQLTLRNDPAAARVALESAVRAHLNKVREFSTIPSGAFAMTATSINNYVSGVMTQYDAASDKLEVIMREFYKASFGNGMLAYNNYRRTGKPTNLATLSTPPSTFAYRMLYPDIYRTSNLNPDNVFVPISSRIWWANQSLNLNF